MAEPASHDDGGGGATPPCLSPHYGTGSHAESDRAGLADASQPWLQAVLGLHDLFRCRSPGRRGK